MYIIKQTVVTHPRNRPWWWEDRDWRMTVHPRDCSLGWGLVLDRAWAHAQAEDLGCKAEQQALKKRLAVINGKEQRVRGKKPFIWK